MYVNEQSVGDRFSIRLVPKGIQNQDVITASKLTRRTIINKLYTSIINNSTVKLKLIASYRYNYGNYRNSMYERIPWTVIFCKNHTRTTCNGAFTMHKSKWTNNDYLFYWFVYVYVLYVHVLCVLKCTMYL